MVELNTDLALTVNILVCTYKRPAMLGRLLDSIAAQRVSGLQPSVIVIDNDPDGAAADTVNAARDSGFPFGLTYLNQPTKSISLTRNLGLDTAKADYVAFVDDDEFAEPQWLQSLVDISRAHDADIVFGPVLPVYPTVMPDWLINGRFYERPRHASGTPVDIGEARTGNVLIRAACIRVSGLRFDPALGLSGGEDYVFFKALYLQGATAVWADQAVVYEEVPLDRANSMWLLKRSFRHGSVEAALSCRPFSVFALARIALKIVYLFLCSILALFLSPFRKKTLNFYALRRLAISGGLMYGLVMGTYHEYK